MSKPSDAALKAAREWYSSLASLSCDKVERGRRLAQFIDTAADQKYSRLKQAAGKLLEALTNTTLDEVDDLNQALQELGGDADFSLDMGLNL